MGREAGVAYYQHELSPFLLGPFEIGPLKEVGLRWYGMAYVAGFLIGYAMFRRWARAGWLPLRLDEVDDFLFSVCFLGIVIGGRLGYCLIYQPTTTWDDPGFVLRIWEGGMASHGAVVGLAVACWWFARSKRVSFLRLGDALCLAATPGIFLGRIANFINGELWGRPTDVPWAVIFAQTADEQRRHPSQLYEAALEGLLLGMVLWAVKRWTRQPGTVLATLLVLYPIVRIVGECFREPDRHIGYLAGGLTMGQWLSVAMLLAGLVTWGWVGRQKRVEGRG